MINADKQDANTFPAFSISNVICATFEFIAGFIFNFLH